MASYDNGPDAGPTSSPDDSYRPVEQTSYPTPIGTGSGAGYKQFPAKSYTPPELPTAQDLYVQSAEAGQIVPIVFGSARVSPNIIERMEPIQLKAILRTEGNADFSYWTESTYYYVGACVQTRDTPNFYLCTQAGTSGTDLGVFLNHPATVTEGGCVWYYLGTQQQWLQRVALAFCEGPITGAGKAWVDKCVYAQWNGSPVGLGRVHDWMVLATGTQPQSRPAWTAAWNYADTYANTAVLWWYLPGGQSNNAPNVSLEIKADSTTDVNPADIVTTLITHARKGAGWSGSRLYAPSFDTSAASWRTYCRAAGWNVSWVIDSQSSVLQLLGVLCTATQTDLLISGGALKFVPRCDQSITANGVTFTPVTAPVYDLDQDDLLAPLGVSRVSSTDTFNSFPVEYYDRAQDYERLVVDDPDMSDVDARGMKQSGTTSVPLIMSQAQAIWLSRSLAQRSLNCRNTYTLKLPGWRYCLLEPTDALTVSDPVMNVSRVPVRITAMEETLDADGASTITVTAEDYPAAAYSAATYTTQAGDGYRPDTSNAFDGIVIGADQIGGGAVPVGQLTSGATDNLWPNPTSENDPPFGADTTGAEFGCRYNAGSDAYAGSWVRQIVGGQTATGGELGVGNETRLPIRVACAPGDSFYMEAMIDQRGGGDSTAGIWGYFVDGSGAMLSGAGGSSVVGSPGAWTRRSFSVTAPAGAVAAVLYPWAHNGVTAWFDAIYARRKVAGSIVSNDTIGAAQTQSRYGVVCSGYPYSGSTNVYLQGYGFNSLSIVSGEAILDVTPPTAPAGTSIVGVSLQGTQTSDAPLGTTYYSIELGSPLGMQMTGRSGNQIKFKLFSGTSAVNLTAAGWAFNVRVDYIFG